MSNCPCVIENFLGVGFLILSLGGACLVYYFGKAIYEATKSIEK